jgi:cytochrome c553
MNGFTSRYPSALYHRDEDGRTLMQAAIASGAKTFKNDSVFIGKMTNDEIAELDPVTNQYPFLTCAACHSSDLSTIYVLLSRNPSLLEKYIEQTTDEFAEEARQRKRKRDNGNGEAVVNEE